MFEMCKNAASYVFLQMISKTNFFAYVLGANTIPMRFSHKSSISGRT